MATIEIRERASDFHAQLKDHPEIWGCGKSVVLAIGDLIMHHSAKFDIKVEPIKKLTVL